MGERMTEEELRAHGARSGTMNRVTPAGLDLPTRKGVGGYAEAKKAPAKMRPTTPEECLAFVALTGMEPPLEVSAELEPNARPWSRPRPGGVQYVGAEQEMSTQEAFGDRLKITRAPMMERFADWIVGLLGLKKKIGNLAMTAFLTSDEMHQQRLLIEGLRRDLEMANRMHGAHIIHIEDLQSQINSLRSQRKTPARKARSPSGSPGASTSPPTARRSRTSTTR